MLFFFPPVFSSFFLVLLIYLCVERLCFYVEKGSLIFLIQFLFFSHSFKTNASERAVKVRFWASASLWHPLLGDKGFYLPHPSFQRTLCIHCSRLPKDRLSYRTGFRHNQAYMAQWVQLWRLAEMGNKQE